MKSNRVLKTRIDTSYECELMANILNENIGHVENVGSRAGRGRRGRAESSGELLGLSVGLGGGQDGVDGGGLGGRVAEGSSENAVELSESVRGELQRRQPTRIANVLQQRDDRGRLRVLHRPPH